MLAMRMTDGLARALGVTLAFCAGLGCRPNEPAQVHFYDQHIQPILTNFCVGGTSPCHRVDQTTHTALGNLDLSSFDGVQKRRDVLRTYGSYPAAAAAQGDARRVG